VAWVPTASGETASSGLRPFQAGLIDVGAEHACAVLGSGAARCWGHGLNGRLGYGDTANIGDNELPDTAGPVAVGPGRTVRSVAAGDQHTCALLDDGTVRCWGNGANGRLGYGNTNNVGDGVGQSVAAAGPVNLGAGRTATAITAGAGHTCALLDDGNIRCWGVGANGRLGYGPDNGPGGTADVGDNETPGSVDPAVLPAAAVAVSAGGTFTCAILVDGRLYCWGAGAQGRLGYGNTSDIGDDEDPRDAGSVNLGSGRTARAISAGSAHSCAVLDDGTVRCWGNGSNGKLGYANVSDVGDDETPVGPVDLGLGRTARAISAGGQQSCAILDNDTVRCWGQGSGGLLGYGNTTAIGDNETPAAAGPVNVGAGRTVRALNSGNSVTCALRDDGSLLCWGFSGFGALGYGNVNTIGDNETPDTAGPVQVGGAMTSGRGDASLTLTAGATTREVGQDVTLTATLASGGPDAVDGAVTTLSLSPGLQLASATTTAGSFAGGVLTAPSLAPGSTAVLTVVAHVTAAGAQTALVEVTALAPSFVDLDSTPNNHAAGEDDQASVTITATNPPVLPMNTPPVLSGLSMLRRTFAVAPGPTATDARRLTPRGSSFRFTLSEPATVAILVERRRTGRRVGARCVAVARGNRNRPRCTRYTRAGLLTRRNLAAGRRTVAFTGRIGRRALALGAYRATLTPTDAAGLGGTARRIAFTIKRR
jgi:alpha-tubulin suppressor-like RCC1 family protein